MNLKGSRQMVQRHSGESLFFQVGIMSALKQALRTRLRHLRRSITPYEQNIAALKITKHLFLSSFYKHAQKIAIYIPFDGEVPTYLILQQALRQHKACYAPVVGNKSMNFVKIDLLTPFKANQFGILEPNYPLMKPIPANQLDVVIVPLVGFDNQCYRLGMGKGYYDKAFAFRKNRGKPKLIGLAYELQKVPMIPRNRLDILLDEVVTPSRIYKK